MLGKVGLWIDTFAPLSLSQKYVTLTHFVLRKSVALQKCSYAKLTKRTFVSLSHTYVLTKRSNTLFCVATLLRSKSECCYAKVSVSECHVLMTKTKHSESEGGQSGR